MRAMHAGEEWLPGPAEPVLGENEIHLWLARLDEPWQISEFANELDDGERRAAARFRREQDQKTYVISHGLRRRLLGR